VGAWRALITTIGGAALATMAVVMVTPATVWAGATASTEVITEPGVPTPLAAGGSAAPYGVDLPSGASCPGDTAHQGFHIYSYLVPKGVPPAVVSFKTGDPSRYFGYIDYGSYYGAMNTAVGTGQIVSLPAAFTWTRLTPHDLFPDGQRTATWEGGIACADTHGVVTNYWNSEIVFTASSSDPGGFTWRVVQPAAITPSSSPTGLWIGLGLIGLAIVFGTVAFTLSRRNRLAEQSSRPEPGGSQAESNTRGEVEHAVR